MDPFTSLPTEIYEHILQFLEVQECLKVVSLLSKAWYQAVGSSSHCMKQTKLNLKSNRKTNFPERIETLQWMSQKDARKYQHLQVNCLLDEEISREVWNFLESLSGSVESINIRSMKFDPDEDVRKIALPKLEELKMMFIPRQAMNSFLTATSSLKRLILRNEFPLCYEGIDYAPSDVTVHCVKNCIVRNKQLEELELQGRPNFLSFFTEDLTRNFSFRLKKLVVKIEMPLDKIVQELEDNFIKFLTLQSETLESVYIDNCAPRIIKHVFSELPAVTFIRFDIQIKEPNKLIVKDMNLQPNEKVKQLELPYIVLYEDIIEFLDLTPNAEDILIGHMNPRMLAYVTTKLPKLKSIVFRHDDCADGCVKQYGDLKTANPNINQAIQMTECNEFL